MPVTVEEKFDSRRSTTGQSPSVELLYVVRGTDDDLEAKEALADAAPVVYDGLLRLGLQLDPVAEDVWDGVARYGSQESSPPPQTGESSFSFDTGGGTQHITHSRATVATYAPPGQTAPNYQGAIGVTENGVEGIDITVPVFNFAETHYLPNEAVTDAYKGVLFRLTGKVNNAPFKGLAIGECQFQGASGAKRGQGDWEITFRFAGSPNAVGLSVGPIGGIAKKGWEYLWVRYADVEDANANALVKRPVAAYVEQVYESANFALLGIGT